MSIFETGMLVCFGLSWPISIRKSIKSKDITGKSRLFLIIVIFGYISGIIHKIIYSRDSVIFLYALNLIMVAIDLYLCFYYSGKKPVAAVS